MAKAKYRDDFPKKAMDAARRGLIDTQIAKELGISEASFYNYQKKHLEFLEAIKKGRETSNEKVVNALFQRATGYSHTEEKIFQHAGKPVVVETVKHYPPDSTSIFFWLCNRSPDDWKSINKDQPDNRTPQAVSFKFNVVNGGQSED